MKRLIIETDIGADCDDALALALVAELCRRGECKIDSIIASTARPWATQAIDSILKYYNIYADVGRCDEPFLKCDSMDNYARAIAQIFNGRRSEFDSVELLRRRLTNCQDKVTLITLGPLGNMARFLRSAPDSISPLYGEELLLSKVDTVFLMAGAFGDKDSPDSEWNVAQDIDAAAYVVDKLKLPSIFIPYEAGNKIFSGMNLAGQSDNPAWHSMIEYSVSEKLSEVITRGRESWDPITCFAAVKGCHPSYSLSECGTVRINERGKSIFIPNINGQHRYLKVEDTQHLSQTINELIK